MYHPRHPNPRKRVMPEFNEIIELYKFCAKNGIDATLSPFDHGHKLTFANGRDFVQHEYSHRSDEGYVEAAIGCEADYEYSTLEEAKELVLKFKDRLNKRRDYDD